MIVLVLVVVIKLWAQDHLVVERVYTSDFYYSFSIGLRRLFGWIPFSFGDILYFTSGCWIFWKVVKNCIGLFKKEFSKDKILKKLWKFILAVAFIYLRNLLRKDHNKF